MDLLPWLQREMQSSRTSSYIICKLSHWKDSIWCLICVYIYSMTENRFQREVPICFAALVQRAPLWRLWCWWSAEERRGWQPVQSPVAMASGMMCFQWLWGLFQTCDRPIIYSWMCIHLCDNIYIRLLIIKAGENASHVSPCHVASSVVSQAIERIQK